MEATREVGELGRRISELGVMLTRTALDESAPIGEREEEITRLLHLIRRRLDDCASVTELRRVETVETTNFDEFVDRVLERAA